MGNFMMHIQYDGSRYKGWQRLGGDDAAKTVQGKIEAVLERLFEEKVEINGASRTDAGVHAMYQAANFQCETELKPAEIHAHLIQYLPEDIAVLSVKVADPQFHARFNAKGKTYQYRIDNGKVLSPFTRKYVMHSAEKLNLDEMKKGAAFLVGTHDFTTFTNVKSKKNSMVRTVDSINIKKEGHMIYIDIVGNGFLHNMVRKIVSTLFEVGKGNLSPEKVKEILEKKDRSLCPGTAPAEGLFLMKIEY